MHRLPLTLLSVSFLVLASGCAFHQISQSGSGAGIGHSSSQSRQSQQILEEYFDLLERKEKLERELYASFKTSVGKVCTLGTLFCGGGGQVTPEKPDKGDKPEPPTKPDRSKFIEADRKMTELTIEALEATRDTNPRVPELVKMLRENHEGCRAGTRKCVGEP